MSDDRNQDITLKVTEYVEQDISHRHVPKSRNERVEGANVILESINIIVTLKERYIGLKVTTKILNVKTYRWEQM